MARRIAGTGTAVAATITTATAWASTSVGILSNKTNNFRASQIVIDQKISQRPYLSNVNIYYFDNSDRYFGKYSKNIAFNDGISSHKSTGEVSARLASISKRVPEVHLQNFKDNSYKSRKLMKEEILYKYHGVDNRTGRKITYLTNIKYQNEDIMRRELAIDRNWGKINQISKFRVPAGVWISEGVAGSQGKNYPGGGYQAIISNVPRTWVLNTTKAFENE